jgi:type IV pilus assembly protein PilE
MKTKHRKQLGVNLIELMIVVAVISILSAIAYPSYRNYIIKANRSEAKIALLAIQVAEEKWFLQNGTYVASVTTLGLSPTTPKGNYDIGIAPGGTGIASSYVATASPHTGKSQASDTTCPSFTMDQTGKKGPDTLPAECWR